MKRFIAVILLGIVAVSSAHANQQSSAIQTVTASRQSSTSGDSALNLTTVQEKTIQLIAPIGDDVWYSWDNYYNQRLYSIQWESQDINSVHLDYSTDGGATWMSIAEDIPAQPGVYEWSVPEYESSDCFIRVLDTTDSTISVMNTESFTIAPYPSIEYPIGLEYLRAGDTATIRWSSIGIDSLRIEYSDDGGNSWHIVDESVDATPGEYDWVVPDIMSTSCRLQLTDTSDSLITFRVSNTFAIYKPITISSPTSGAVWRAGEEHTIAWDGTWIDNIAFNYSANNGGTWYYIGSCDPDRGTFTWVPPDNPSTSCLLRIYLNENTYHVSDVFTIESGSGPPSVRLLSPNGGERIDAPSSIRIHWTSINVDRINIEYSLDGSDWILAKYNVNAATGYDTWRPQMNTTQDISLRIVSTSDESVYDISDGTITINTGLGITVLSPNSGETVSAGSQVEIIWETFRSFIVTQSMWDFTILYSIDNGETWADITEVSLEINPFKRQHSYLWTVPDVDSESCLVKVTTDSGPAVDDQSDAAFTISTAVEVAEEHHPELFVAAACYPNPFNPRTTIAFQLPGTSDVSIAIYNALGQQVREYVLERMEAGAHNIVFDASALTSGLYFYRIDTEYEAVTGKMLYMK